MRPFRLDELFTETLYLLTVLLVFLAISLPWPASPDTRDPGKDSQESGEHRALLATEHDLPSTGQQPHSIDAAQGAEPRRTGGSHPNQNHKSDLTRIHPTKGRSPFP